jgi:hypothetical protein
MTGYASLPINRCPLMTAAHGGQTVVSGATEMLCETSCPTEWSSSTSVKPAA